MSISVNPLKFAANALEPFISEKTIGFHYGKHLQNYVNTANALTFRTFLKRNNLHSNLITTEKDMQSSIASCRHKKKASVEPIAPPKRI